jgi:hypothetical protein
MNGSLWKVRGRRKRRFPIVLLVESGGRWDMLQRGK